jgi:hypothetical protein
MGRHFLWLKLSNSPKEGGGGLACLPSTTPTPTAGKARIPCLLIAGRLPLLPPWLLSVIDFQSTVGRDYRRQQQAAESHRRPTTTTSEADVERERAMMMMWILSEELTDRSTRPPIQSAAALSGRARGSGSSSSRRRWWWWLIGRDRSIEIGACVRMILPLAPSRCPQHHYTDYIHCPHTISNPESVGRHGEGRRSGGQRGAAAPIGDRHGPPNGPRHRSSSSRSRSRSS